LHDGAGATRQYRGIDNMAVDPVFTIEHAVDPEPVETRSRQDG
jgi:hypothetical protein